MNPFVGYDNFIPLLAPADITTTATRSSYMDLKGANRAAFLVCFGAITGTTTDTEVVTVEAASAVDAAEAAVAFSYRLSGAVGTNTWGAITAATTAGVALTVSDDDKLLWIEINPDAMAASKYRYVRVLLTDTPDMANCVVAVMGVLDASYKQTTFVSATASASA
jgi:hypothetical protein